MTFADRLRISLPTIIPESVDRLAMILQQLIRQSCPARDLEMVDAQVLQVFASGRMSYIDLKVIAEFSPSLLNAIVQRSEVGALKFRQDCLRDGIDWRFIFNALIDFPGPVVARPEAIPAPAPKPDSAKAFFAILVDMAREEMARAVVNKDLALVVDDPANGLELQETANGHVARAEALLAGAQALWGQL